MSEITRKLAERRRANRARSIEKAAWFGGGTILTVLVLYIALGHLLAPPPLRPFADRFVALWNESPQTAFVTFLPHPHVSFGRIEKQLVDVTETATPRIGKPDLSDAVDSREVLVRLVTRLRSRHGSGIPALVRFPVESSPSQFVEVRLRCKQRTWNVTGIWMPDD